MNNKPEKMQEFALRYFEDSESDINIANLKFEFDDELQELKIFEDEQWAYSVDERFEDDEDEKIEVFVLSARDVNNTDIYMLPTFLVG